jgi:GT2 family glycosyltransferase
MAGEPASPLVSAIVVNWNGAAHLTVLLPSLTSQTYPLLEVVVVDNGSTDESELVSKKSGVRWYPLGANLGLAAALNLGARVANGQFLLFLNNDMRLHPNFVYALLLPLLSDGCLFATDAKQLDWGGGKVMHGRTTLVSATPRGRSGLVFAQHDASRPAFCVFGSTANLMVRRWMMEALGGWDARYPMGWEDVDLCWRAWLRGWPTLYVPSAVCWHRVGGSASSREGAERHLEGVLKGRLLFAAMHLPTSWALNVVAATTAGVLRDLVRGKAATAAVRLRVLRWYAGLLPRVLSERRALYLSAGSSPGAHLARLTEVVQLSYDGESERGAKNTQNTHE